MLAEKMHSKGMSTYLTMMATRLLECHRLLAKMGSMYLHCDHSANTYLRMLMDAVFGKQNFHNEIIWSYGKTSNAAAKKFLRGHDVILFYAKNAKLLKHNPQFETRLSTRKRQLIETGYNTKNMNGQRYLYIYDEAKVNAKVKSGKIKISEFDIIRRVDTTRGNAITTVWDLDHLNSQAKEVTGWAMQKPIALYSRMILASSNPGDVVLDPFCGCATTLVAAENAGRQWIGIDREKEAEKQVLIQLAKLNENTADFWRDRVIVRRDLPARTDLGDIPHYRTHFSALYTEQNGVCKLCLEQYDSHVMEMDHIVARSKGGKDNRENLQLLCTRCNKLKGNLSMTQAIAKAKKLGIRKED